MDSKTGSGLDLDGSYFHLNSPITDWDISLITYFSTGVPQNSDGFRRILSNLSYQSRNDHFHLCDLRVKGDVMKLYLSDVTHVVRYPQSLRLMEIICSFFSTRDPLIPARDKLKGDKYLSPKLFRELLDIPGQKQDIVRRQTELFFQLSRFRSFIIELGSFENRCIWKAIKNETIRRLRKEFNLLDEVLPEKTRRRASVVIREEHAKLKTSQKKSIIKSFPLKEDQLILFILEEGFFIKEGPKLSIIPKSAFLGFIDSIECELNLYLFSKMKPYFSEIGRLSSLIRNAVIEHGEPMFEIHKNIVPFIQSSILKKLEQSDDPLYNQFSETVMKNLKKITSKTGDHTSNVIPETISSIFQDISNVLERMDIDDRCDLIALEKCCLHPILGVREAILKVREHISTPHELDNKVIHKVLACFKVIIINGYLKRYQIGWPQIDENSIVNDDLKRLYLKSMPLTNQHIKTYWFEISQIHFKKTFNPDEYDPTSDLLQDKAIAPIRKEWLSCFSGSVLGEKREQPTKPKRLIDYMLQVPEMKSLSVLEYVKNRKHLLDNSNNISYSMKEKENKTSARLFAKMTCDLRACQIVLEGLTAKFVAPLFPEHGSVLTFLDLERDLSTLSSLQNSYTHKRKELSSEVTYLTTDLVKYCLRWRSQVTSLFFETLDELFGFEETFNWMHPFLMTNRLFVADPGYPPLLHLGRKIETSLDDDFFIDGSLGGIEGYQQKEWSAISIALIKASAIWSGTIAPSIVQGDNQVIAITSLHYQGQTREKINHEHLDSVKRFLKTFTEFNSAMGHELKVEETIISREIFVYSKKIYRKGRSMGIPGKKVMKSFCFDPDAKMNFLSSVALYESCISSGIKEGLTPDVESWSDTRRHLFIKTLVAHASLSPLDRLESINCLHNMVKINFLPIFLHVFMGGFSTLTNESFTIQRIDDVLTSSIQTLLSICGDKIGLKIVIERMKGLQSTTPLKILMNPLGLELDDGLREEPPALDHEIRDLMYESKNTLVTCALDYCGSEELEDFASKIIGNNSVHVLLASTIFDNSLQGRLFGFLNGLCKTRTLQQKVLKRQKYMLQRKRIITLEASGKVRKFVGLIGEEKLRVNDSGSINLLYYEVHGYQTCSLEIAEKLRSMRGKMCKGKENLVFRFHSSPSIREMISIQTVPPSVSQPHLVVTLSPGSGGSPYLGSSTEERTNHNDWDQDTLTPPGKTAIQLATLSKWITGDTKIVESVVRNLLQVGEEEMSMEDLPEQVLSRNFDHRLNSTRAETTYMVPYKDKMNYKMSFSTNFFKITSDMILHGDNNKILDSDDTNVIYQNCIIHCLSSTLSTLDKSIEVVKDIVDNEPTQSQCTKEVNDVGYIVENLEEESIKRSNNALQFDTHQTTDLIPVEGHSLPVSFKGNIDQRKRIIAYGVLKRNCCIRLSDFMQVPFDPCCESQMRISCNYKPFATTIIPRLRAKRMNVEDLGLYYEEKLGYLMGYYLGRILIRSSSKVRGLSEENFLEVSSSGSNKNYSSEISLCNFDAFIIGLVWGLLYTIMSYLNPEYVSNPREVEPHVTQMMVSITHRGLDTLKNTLSDKRVQECRSRSKIRWSYYGVSTENQSILEDLQYLVTRTYRNLPDILRGHSNPPLILDNRKRGVLDDEVHDSNLNPYISTLDQVFKKLFQNRSNPDINIPVVYLDAKIPILCREIVIKIRNSSMGNLSQEQIQDERENSLPDKIRISLGLHSVKLRKEDTIGLEVKTSKHTCWDGEYSNPITGIFVEPVLLLQVRTNENSKLIHLCTRTHGLNSTTGFKCVSLIRNAFDIIPEGPILMMGEGSGNFCALTLRMHEFLRGEENYEMYVQSMHGDYDGYTKELWIPSELENAGFDVIPLFPDKGIYDVQKKKGVFSLQPFPMTNGDILDPSYLSRLEPLIRSCVLITCDAEFESGTNPRLIYRMINYVLERSPCCFIIKCLMRSKMTYLIDEIIASNWYREIKILAYVPYNQGYNDLEVYLIFRLEVEPTPLIDINLISSIRRSLSILEWVKETQSERYLIAKLGIPSNFDKIQLLLRICPKITGKEKTGREILDLIEESIINRVKLTRRTMNRKFSDLSWTQDPVSIFQNEVDYILSQIILIQILENYGKSGYLPEDTINQVFSFILKDTSLTIIPEIGEKKIYSFKQMDIKETKVETKEIPRPLAKNVLKLVGHIILLLSGSCQVGLE
ncbi:Large [Sunshine Coast virus]|uniref:RNA-directed RNA polymerase n=4 Tax=Sunshine Coast virus TaxID=1195087 RepID=I3VIZ3_9MONO|nr:Large [Sunshine Coast virus]AFK79810.1 Large [Sunshine Coast virus]